MAIIKKNIWTLFYIILFISITIFTVLSYMKWKEINNTYQIENENIVRQVSNSAYTYFTQVEMLLKVLGSQLSKEKQYTQVVRSKKIFEELIQINPSIAGFGLVDPNGNYIMFSGDMDQIKMLPNLLEQEASKATFKKALESQQMVLGRTYFFPPLNALIIPARKAIKDSKGNVVAVMTLAIRIDKVNFVNKKILFSKDNVIQLYRDDDMYRQLIISTILDTKNKQLYQKPLKTKNLKKIEHYINKKYGIEAQSLKKTGAIISYPLIPNYEKETKKEYLTSITFIPKYNLWAISQTPSDKIVKTFQESFFIFLLTFIIIFFILYKMFQYIANFEHSKKELLRYQATHDTLTGLANRQYLLNYSSSWFRDYEKFSVLFIDLDNFKYTNDSFGHDIGDLVLKEVTSRLKSLVDYKELIVRHGGDEFIIFSTLIENKQLKKYSKKIIELLSEPYYIQDLTIVLGASIGVSSFPEDGSNLNELISCSDVALYEAKKKKNDYCIFKKKLKNILLAQLEIENEMKQALANNEFYMVYQPQINSDGTIHGAEALIRWENKKLGAVQPDTFIPIAENNGFISFLGNYILDTVLNEIYMVQKKTSFTFQISINISLRQFMESDFYENVLTKIKSAGIEPKKVTLEITESLYMHDIDYIIELLKKLKKTGIKISMDDFGTGYSSLSILNKLPIDELKIDKQFMDDMIKNTSSFQMIQSIINLGKAFEFHLLAEGIESKEQMKILKNIGCKTYQGYYYSKPLKKKDFEKYILDNFSDN